MSYFKKILITGATPYLKGSVIVLGYQLQDSTETLIQKFGLVKQ